MPARLYNDGSRTSVEIVQPKDSAKFNEDMKKAGIKLKYGGN